MFSFAIVAARQRRAWIALAAAFVLGILIFLLPRPAPIAPESSSGLSTSYDSVQAEQLRRTLPSAGVDAALVVVSRTDGGALTDADRSAITRQATAVAPLAVGQHLAPPRISDNGAVAIVAVPLSTVDGDAKVSDVVSQLRSTFRADLPSGLRAEVTGGPAFTADLTAVFDGADVTLLLVTVLVVAIVLILTYRSPVLWIVPLLVAAATEQVTARLVEVLLPILRMPADPSSAGITSVLVFGAATDYALLLIARYREELHRVADRFEAMSSAIRRTSSAIVASGGTVVLAVLTLLLSDSANYRTLGVSAAIGVTLAVLSALFVLPVVLVLCGRVVFWPFVPRPGTSVQSGRAWGWLGTKVARRPRVVLAASLIVLIGLAVGGLGVRIGLSETQQFRVRPEAVLGAQTLARAFPAGSTQPVWVLTTPAATDRVMAAIRGVDGVVSATPGDRSQTVAQIDVVLAPEPGTSESDRAIGQLRSAVATVATVTAAESIVDGKVAVVGGAVATNLDVRNATTRDVRIILPMILLVVAIVLLLLLRSIVAPALLVASVIVSYFASLGASWMLFHQVFGFAALDTGVILLSFVFLVALGVDYNIFLVTRARDDARLSGTRDGMLSALRVTGGVITSAGVLLAAVFAVLGVLPLIALTQIGVIVCVGVLLDTLVVRTVLVPALAFTLGDRFWWPSDGLFSRRVRVATGESGNGLRR